MLKLLQKTRRLVDLLQCIPLLILCIRKYAIYNYLSVNSNRNQSPPPPPFLCCAYRTTTKKHVHGYDFD